MVCPLAMDGSGNVVEANEYYRFGEMSRLLVSFSSTDEKFTGKELENDSDEKVYYFGAGRRANLAASKVVTRTGLSNKLFRSSSTGRFMSDSFGYTTEAVRDATKVTIGLGF